MVFHRTFIHVLPVLNQWEVKVHGNKDQDRFFTSEEEAEQIADELAHKVVPSELMIHNAEGAIQKHASYE